MTSSNNTNSIAISIPCLLRGGTERQTLMLVRALCKQTKSTQVSVLCYFEHEEAIVNEFRETGTKVVLMNLERSIPLYRLILQLRQAFRQANPDILHIQYMAPGFAAVLAARLAGIRRVIATVHYPATPHGKKARFLLRLAAKLCKRFICVSQAVEKSWFNNSALLDPDNRVTLQRTHVTIPNAIDITLLDETLNSSSPIDCIASLPTEATIIGAVSRLSHEKGIDRLLKAFAIVSEKHIDTRLLIVGDGSDKHELTELADKLGISDQVVWTGSQPWHTAMQCISRMDILALPSRYEGFGLSAIEAMACGKPVVAFDTDGLSEVITHGKTGILVPVNDHTAMANALIDLVKDHANRSRLGKEGRNKVECDFSFDLFCRKQRSLLDTIMSDK